MDELLNRQPPQSLEAEQAVLGSILIDSRCVADVVGILTPGDFFLRQNQEIFETIYTMFNFSQTIDPVTVLNKMKELGVYHDNSTDYIKQLMEITPTAANAQRYANIVREKAMLRGLAQASTDISEMVSDEVGTASEMLETAEKKIYALRKGERNDSLEHIGTILHKVYDRLTELGYEIVFCARPVGAKSNLHDLSLYYAASKDGVHFTDPVLIVSPRADTDAYDNASIYRASIVKIDGFYRIYYSSMSERYIWKISLCEFTQ